MTWLEKGGVMMWPILAGSVVAMALVVERAWFHWRRRLDVGAFVEEVTTLASDGRGREAAELCASSDHPVAWVLRAGLERAGGDPGTAEKAMEREGHRQASRAERNLPYLAMVIGLEPMMGFLGTILGLIEAFMAWERLSTSVTVSALAAGIYQAMITTAAGLAVAIPYYAAYVFFQARAESMIREMNTAGDELASVLRRRAASGAR